MSRVTHTDRRFTCNASQRMMGETAAALIALHFFLLVKLNKLNASVNTLISTALINIDKDKMRK